MKYNKVEQGRRDKVEIWERREKREEQTERETDGPRGGSRRGWLTSYFSGCGCALCETWSRPRVSGTAGKSLQPFPGLSSSSWEHSGTRLGRSRQPGTAAAHSAVGLTLQSTARRHTPTHTHTHTHTHTYIWIDTYTDKTHTRHISGL